MRVTFANAMSTHDTCCVKSTVGLSRKEPRPESHARSSMAPMGCVLYTPSGVDVYLWPQFLNFLADCY